MKAHEQGGDVLNLIRWVLPSPPGETVSLQPRVGLYPGPHELPSHVSAQKGADKESGQRGDCSDAWQRILRFFGVAVLSAPPIHYPVDFEKS